MLLTDGEMDELEAAPGARRPGLHREAAVPLRALLRAAALVEAQEAEPDLTGRRILLAEDNELNQEIASEMLGRLGLGVEWAENGQICTEKFAASAPGWYDAILMDLRMPAMTGFEATAAIRALSREDAHYRHQRRRVSGGHPKAPGLRHEHPYAEAFGFAEGPGAAEAVFALRPLRRRLSSTHLEIRGGGFSASGHRPTRRALPACVASEIKHNSGGRFASAALFSDTPNRPRRQSVKSS